MDWGVVEALAAAVGGVSGVIALVVSIFALRKAERANWYTGAMESHSTLQLRIAARQARIKSVWWDRSRHGEFPSLAKIEHGEEVNLETIYFDFPRQLRKRRRRWQFWR